MSKRNGFILLFAVGFILLISAYLKHFDNGFHFDDSHTILNNTYIRDISNIPDFFTKGAETFSSLPQNQVYRPVVSTSIAIDYYISSKFDDNGSGYNSFYYHLSMFIEYIILLILLYFFILHIFNKTINWSWNRLAALFASVFFGLHVVNAETINYIISRSDLISSLFVLAGFVIYQYLPDKRKYGLFLIPVILGMLTKLTAAMFFPILLAYFILFEFNSFKNKFNSTKTMILKLSLQSITLLVLVVSVVIFVISMQGDSFDAGGGRPLKYLLTQFYVLLHYFVSYFYAYNLSADADLGLLSLNDYRVYPGMVFILASLFAIYKTFKNSELRPISFGLIWFFFALAPTSSIMPLAEVMNDHRMFYPFIGLTISVFWTMVLLFHKYHHNILNSKILKNSLLVLFALMLFAHTYATRQRVEVWDNGTSLWYDVTVKSPENGRGLMNYALRMMSEKKYDKALEYFEKALEHSPDYSYLHTNLGVLKYKTGKYEEAEKHYKNAIRLAPYMANSYYFYANFLKNTKRYAEAAQNYKYAINVAPNYIYSYRGLMFIYNEINDYEALQSVIDKVKEFYPGDKKAEFYQKKLDKTDISINDLLKQSMFYYKLSDYGKVISLSREILEKDIDNISAYNNMCAAYNKLEKFDEAIEAGEKALKIRPNSTLASNNLGIAKKRKLLSEELNETSGYNELISLSLNYYSREMYRNSIEACLKAIEIDEEKSKAYNNICASLNSLGDYENAIKFGKKAIEKDPENKLARNNLYHARKMYRISGINKD